MEGYYGNLNGSQQEAFDALRKQVEGKAADVALAPADVSPPDHGYTRGHACCLDSRARMHSHFSPYLYIYVTHACSWIHVLLVRIGMLILQVLLHPCIGVHADIMIS